MLVAGILSSQKTHFYASEVPSLFHNNYSCTISLGLTPVPLRLKRHMILLSKIYPSLSGFVKLINECHQSPRYLFQQPCKSYVRNNYVIPSDKKRKTLRWQIRQKLAEGVIPSSALGWRTPGGSLRDLTWDSCDILLGKTFKCLFYVLLWSL